MWFLALYLRKSPQTPFWPWLGDKLTSSSLPPRVDFTWQEQVPWPWVKLIQNVQDIMFGLSFLILRLSGILYRPLNWTVPSDRTWTPSWLLNLPCTCPLTTTEHSLRLDCLGNRMSWPFQTWPCHCSRWLLRMSVPEEQNNSRASSCWSLEPGVLTQVVADSADFTFSQKVQVSISRYKELT